jgi:hypothetical protein
VVGWAVLAAYTAARWGSSVANEQDITKLNEHERDVRETLARKAQAESLLNDPLFKGAFDSVEAWLMHQWRGARDTETREDIHKRVESLDLIRKVLERHIRSGTVAEAELEDILVRKRVLQGERRSRA